MPSGYIDLHCHWIPNIDDGARSVEDGLRMLAELGALGFRTVVATPHMRPGLFDNTRVDLENAYAQVQPVVVSKPDLPQIALSSEHYLDDTVFQRLLAGSGLPYPGGRAVLIELSPVECPSLLDYRLVDLCRHRLIPVIAHPERNAGFQKDHQTLLEWIRQGALAQVDAGSLTGMFGKPCQIFSEHLLRAGAVHLVASDAHRDQGRNFLVLGHAYKKVEALTDSETAKKLFVDNPRCLWEGRPLAPGIPDESAFKLSFVDKIRRLLSTP